jgi:hypothetical protein
MADQQKPLLSAQAEREEGLTQELRSIYGEEKPGEVDMTRLERMTTSLGKKILIALVVFFAFLAAVSWAGFFFFSPDGGAFSGDKVRLTVDGPREVKGGERVTYLIRYENGESVALGTANLDVRLPKEFLVAEEKPSRDDGLWRIGSLGAGAEGSVEISGVFVAPLDKELDLQAILTYRPSDFNSEFQKVETGVVTVKDSVLELGIAGPPKVLPGDDISLVLTYKNASENAFTDIVVRTAFPQTFISESSEPAATDTSVREWRIPSLDAGAEGTITVHGSFASDTKGRVELPVEIGFLGEEDAFQLQRTAILTTDVLEGDLVTTLILNGKDGRQPVNFGDRLRYTIGYRNTGSVSLGNVEVALVFETEPRDASMLLWNDVEDAKAGVRDGNRITWTSKQIAKLERIGPDDDGVINVEVPILAAPLPDVTDVDYHVDAWVETRIGTIDGEKTDRVTKTQPIEARVNSDAAFASLARYFDGDGQPVGSGPLPPVAGEQTTYQVTWHLANTFHDLSDLRISAKLPPNVTWTGRSDADAGEVSFDAAAEKISWNLNWLPVSIKDLSVSFTLGIIPADEQVGKLPTLVDAAIFEATDRVTGATILIPHPPLTTGLDGDDFAAGKGRVQSE